MAETPNAKNSESYQRALQHIRENARTSKPLLDLRSLELRILPSEISQLGNLQRLFLRDNNLSEFPSEITYLANLHTLDISNNQLEDLPREILQLVNLQYLDLRGNRLSIPEEILSRWTEAPVILNYLRENYFQVRQEDIRPLKEVKVLLVGQGRVGKTSLVKYLVHNEQCDPEEPLTHGIKRESWHIDVTDAETQQGHNVQLNIWDFGGQDIMHSTHEFFLTSRSLYLLVLDAGRDEAGNKLDYWLRKIKSFGSNAPIIVVVNKSESNTLPLAYKELQQNYNIKEFFDASCEDGREIPALREAIRREIGLMKEVFQPIRKEWFAVKSTLENLKKDYISIEKYREICQANQVTNRQSQDTLLILLHELGVMLHFPGYKTKVLNPEWVRRGVYKIVTSLSVMEHKGVLTPALLAAELEVLNDELHRENKDYLCYPPEEYNFITDLMQQFELCYPIVDSKDFFVPALLPKDTPFVGDWNEKDCLGFRYNYETGLLHESIMSRFIVKIHRYILNNTQWLTGVLLENEHGNQALVKADVSVGVVNILIKGNENTRREFLGIIREQFHRIHSDLKGNKPVEEVPLKAHPHKFVPYELLLQLERNGKKVGYETVDGKLIEYNVKEMLDGVSTKSEREVEISKNSEREIIRHSGGRSLQKESFVKSTLTLSPIALVFVAAFLLIDYLANGRITAYWAALGIVASLFFLIVIAGFAKTDNLTGDNLVQIVGKILDKIGILKPPTNDQTLDKPSAETPKLEHRNKNIEV